MNHLNLRQKIWLKINDKSRETYNINTQIKFKTTMLKSSLVIMVMHIYLLKDI